MKSSTIEVGMSGRTEPSKGKDPSSPVAPPGKRGYWAALLERQRASGLTISAFCRQEQIPLCKFFYWKRRLASGTEPPGGSGEGPDSFLFSEFSLAPPPPGWPSGGVEIRTPGGFVIRADAGADAVWVARLIRALDEKAGSPEKAGRPEKMGRSEKAVRSC